MYYLTVFNFIVNMLIIGYIGYKYNPFYISVNKTFWCNKIYSYTLMMYTFRGEYGSSSRGIFTLKIRNAKKLDEWDNAMFKSGEYKKYRN